MKQGKVIKKVFVQPGIQTIELDGIYPIAKISGVKYSNLKPYINDIESKVNCDGVTYLNRFTVNVEEEGSLEVVLGAGYFAEIDKKWTKRFANTQGWSGGDGIYSFNLTTGKDQFDQPQDFTNLFVFGDTFVGRTDKKTKRRYEPLLMPNNTMGYLDEAQSNVDFLINYSEKDSVIPFFSIDKRFDIRGTIPQNLVTYDQKHENEGWISGFYPKAVTVSFDFPVPNSVSHIHVYNYFSKEDPSLSSRGVKKFKLLGSNDKLHWDDLGDFELKESESLYDYTTIQVGKVYQYFKFDINPTLGVGNYNDSYDEGVFAMSRVEFYNGMKKLRDVIADSNSIMLEESGKAWMWLQDGVVINQNLYFFPYIVVSDLNQPEGLQFGIKGVSMVKVPIVNNRLNYKFATQRPTPLLVHKGDSEFAFGGAIMSNTIQSGAVNPDGYIYVYGYKTTIGLRQMIAARVLEDKIEYFDQWEFYDGKTWKTDILDSAPLFDHVSCEFSVSEVLAGKNKGKYLAVFTYDVNSPYVAFSVGETMVGPFTEPQTIYHTPEQEIFKSTTYTYNAKAHPQISESTSVLVSYNTNTYSFEHNMSNADVYHPRFIRLNDTTK